MGDRMKRIIKKARPVEFTCGHIRYFVGNYPRVGSVLFCVDCDKPSVVGKPPTFDWDTYEADYCWTSRKVKGGTNGTCAVQGCDAAQPGPYKARAPLYHVLATIMERHYLRHHATSSLLGPDILIRLESLPPGSPAPF